MRELTALQKNLILCRKASSLTQKELAAQLGISPTTLAGYENAGKDPKIKTLIKLADFFGVSIDEMVRDELSRERFYQLAIITWHKKNA